ncbi:response regulator transcription factor (plasmid) [Bradyrhizobium sp. 183]|uniref:response regulator transcription factor n=1 Tax=unclassified Bradyrhizobium TaxID=2631580 RepID=UPI001FFECD0D|nr:MULTISPECIES: response regulator transcription factor [unclassified Bradyrhizobium]UPJ84964.1 response regulator transcription factor [Bradyrhizobium sp. 184]UPJ92740.1 response regulator transcription factor [Bradyrhizobium sp. 183]
MNRSYKIGCVTIVDNDLDLIQSMDEHLRSNNLCTALAGTLAEALTRYNNVEVTIVNMNLVRHNGFELLRDLRDRADVPIIVVGSRRDEQYAVTWLDAGADEYLTTPLSMDRLLAHINALSRRRFSFTVGMRSRVQGGQWRFGGWELRLKSRKLYDPSGTSVPLTPAEYSLLVTFVEAAERPLSREYLQRATRVHGEILDRSIDVQVLRLRRKLEGDASAPPLIKTVRGVGYLFSMQTERD